MIVLGTYSFLPGRPFGSKPPILISYKADFVPKRSLLLELLNILTSSDGISIDVLGEV